MDARSNAKCLTIGLVSPPIVEGGIRTHLIEIIPRLRARGHKIVLITSTKYEGIAEVDTVQKYRSWGFPTALYGFMPGAICDIFGVIRVCDVVHIHGYPHFLADYLTVTRPFYQKPLIITFHGSFHQYVDQKTMYLKKLHNLLMLRFAGLVDRFIAVSQAEKNEVAKKGVSKSKVETIYNGISSEFAEVERTKRGEPGEKRVLYLSRLTNTKNPGLLIEAMPYVVKEIANVKLIMAGADWGMQKRLENLALRLGVKDAIEFAGEVTEEQKMNFLASCDVFTFTSVQDIFSISVLEASAAGLPVVAFNTRGNSEMIKDGETGILVNELTAGALSDALVKILGKAESAEKMGQRGREYILSKFSWDDAVSQLEKIYYDIT